MEKSAYYRAIEETNEVHLFNIEKLKFYRPLIDAFDNSPDFEIRWATHFNMRVVPVKKLSAKELTIALDEIFFNLPFVIYKEDIDSSDLNIYLKKESLKEERNVGSYSLFVSLSGSKCKIVKLSSKPKIIKAEDAVYAIFCNEEEAIDA